jgi:oxygen-independent coproporphyrinogen-3 oxidase
MHPEYGLQRDLALYLHIPFCDTKCSYCDFNSYAGMESLIQPYSRAIQRELRSWGPPFRLDRVPTIFFGGGTPSLMPLEEMEAILTTCRDEFRLADELELSLEANPGTVALDYLRGLRGLGFNRMSLGVQSFDDDELKALDRIHSGAEAVAAFEAARAAGFENLNLDLIYGLAGQDIDGWRRNVERALQLRPEHLSLYALTIEEGTPLAKSVARGRSPEPDPDLQADMYELARALLADSGYVQYEISNWALPGLACVHNLTYWRYGRWLGVGAGAHSSLDGRRFSTALSPRAYIQRVGRITAPPAPTMDGMDSLLAGMPQVVWKESVDAVMARSDTAILGLRLLEGLSLQEFHRRHGVGFYELYAEQIRECSEAGLLQLEGDRLRLSDRGLLLANEVFTRLLPRGEEFIATPA